MIKTSDRIGITGWTGSIGSNATSCIKVQSRLEDTFNKILQEFNELNLDVYIHLAAVTNVAFCSKNEKDAYMLNSEMPLKFLKAADAAGIKRFIFISTSHVYDHKKKPPYDIDSDTCPITIYAKSKLLAEKKLIKYQPKTKIQVSIARVFSVLNKNLIGDHYLYKNLVMRASSNNTNPIPGLDKKRDFLTDLEVMNKILELAKSSSFPKIVNICSGEAKKIREIAEEVYMKHAKHIDFNSIETFDDGSPETIVGIPSVI